MDLSIKDIIHCILFSCRSLFTLHEGILAQFLSECEQFKNVF